MPVNGIAGTHAAATLSPEDYKLRRATQEFEGELLSCLLGPMEQAFSGLAENGDSAGSDQYGYLGIQALAAALSHSGGIGIGTLVLSQIGGTKVREAGSAVTP
jgi:Rod binding domain-containing protein